MMPDNNPIVRSLLVQNGYMNKTRLTETNYNKLPPDQQAEYSKETTTEYPIVVTYAKYEKVRDYAPQDIQLLLEIEQIRLAQEFEKSAHETKHIVKTIRNIVIASFVLGILAAMFATGLLKI